MPNDAAMFIGHQVKSIMELIAEIDSYQADEDLVEVLIGAVSAWGAVESQVLYPAIEAVLEGSEEIIEPARERLNALYSLHSMMHDEEYSDEPWSTLAKKYVDAVKFHLLADIRDIVPLASQLPARINRELAASMAAMKQDMD